MRSVAYRSLTRLTPALGWRCSVTPLAAPGRGKRRQWAGGRTAAPPKHGKQWSR